MTDGAADTDDCDNAAVADNRSAAIIEAKTFIGFLSLFGESGTRQEISPAQ
jgi:hypothetical protein